MAPVMVWVRCNFYIQQIANSALNAIIQKTKKINKKKWNKNAKQFVVNKKRNAEMAPKYATQTGRQTFHAPTTNTLNFIYTCVCG